MQIPVDQAEFLKLTEDEGALQVRRQRLRILFYWDLLDNPGKCCSRSGSTLSQTRSTRGEAADR